MTAESTQLTVTGTAQREAWLERRLPPVEELRTDLWSIPVPIPENPLRYTTVYVLGGESELTLIDTGTNTETGWQALVSGLHALGAQVTDVTGALVTHFHFDHLGLAAKLRSEVGAWIGMHEADIAMVNRREFADVDYAIEHDVSWILSLGGSRDEAEEILRDGSASVDPRELIHDPDRLIEDGELLKLPGWRLRAVHTPGHTPGHLCFVDDATQLLFAGDHVLPRISPNIGASTLADTDPLADFLSSLDKIGAEDIDEVLPAHEWRFRGLRTRVAELQRHHEHRLAELLDVVRRHPGGTPWDFSAEMTWSRPWSQYGGLVRFSAISETTSHLIHLVRRGDVLVNDNGPVPHYHAAPAR